jgi:hypothetical protein
MESAYREAAAVTCRSGGATAQDFRRSAAHKTPRAAPVIGAFDVMRITLAAAIACYRLQCATPL